MNYKPDTKCGNREDITFLSEIITNSRYCYVHPNSYQNGIWFCFNLNFLLKILILKLKLLFIGLKIY